MVSARVNGTHVVWCGVCSVKLRLDGFPLTAPQSQIAIAADALGWRKTRAYGWTCPACKPVPAPVMDGE